MGEKYKCIVCGNVFEKGMMDSIFSNDTERLCPNCYDILEKTSLLRNYYRTIIAKMMVAPTTSEKNELAKNYISFKYPDMDENTYPKEDLILDDFDMELLDQDEKPIYATKANYVVEGKQTDYQKKTKFITEVGKVFAGYSTTEVVPVTYDILLKSAFGKLYFTNKRTYFVAKNTIFKINIDNDYSSTFGKDNIIIKSGNTEFKFLTANASIAYTNCLYYEIFENMQRKFKKEKEIEKNKQVIGEDYNICLTPGIYKVSEDVEAGTYDAIADLSVDESPLMTVRCPERTLCVEKTFKNLPLIDNTEIEVKSSSVYYLKKTK